MILLEPNKKEKHFEMLRVSVLTSEHYVVVFFEQPK